MKLGWLMAVVMAGGCATGGERHHSNEAGADTTVSDGSVSDGSVVDSADDMRVMDASVDSSIKNDAVVGLDSGTQDAADSSFDSGDMLPDAMFLDAEVDSRICSTPSFTGTLSGDLCGLTVRGNRLVALLNDGDSCGETFQAITFSNVILSGNINTFECGIRSDGASIISFRHGEGDCELGGGSIRIENSSTTIQEAAGRVCKIRGDGNSLIFSIDHGDDVGCLGALSLSFADVCR